MSSVEWVEWAMSSEPASVLASRAPSAHSVSLSPSYVASLVYKTDCTAPASDINPSGAGKTTVVQHILRNREGLKVGVVVNDIAEANIDSAMLAFEDADGIIGLQNGCACCSGALSHLRHHLSTAAN